MKSRYKEKERERETDVHGNREIGLQGRDQEAFGIQVRPWLSFSIECQNQNQNQTTAFLSILCSFQF